MTFIPALFTCDLLVYSEDGVDAHNNPVAEWAEPVSFPVVGWSSPSSSEPKLAGHDRVTVDVELLAPDGFPAGPHDRVVLDGNTFEVVGYPEDYTHGPFWDPGMVVVNLRRVEG